MLPRYASRSALRLSSVVPSTCCRSTAGATHQQFTATSQCRNFSASAAVAATKSSSSSLSTSPPSVTSASPSPSQPLLLRRHLLGLSHSSLTTLLSTSYHLPAYRTRQLIHAIYTLGLQKISDITVLPQGIRDVLSEQYCLDGGAKLLEERHSIDGTKKWVVGFEAGKRRKVSTTNETNTAASSSSSSLSSSTSYDRIECVYIPMRSNNDSFSGSLCVSSQVGCSLSCTFCATGAMDKKGLRNLTSTEILAQVMMAKRQLGDFQGMTPHVQKQQQQNNTSSSSPSSSSFAAHSRRDTLTNIVFMGMGEPFYNYSNVRQAIDILTSHPRAGGIGLGMGRGKITVSTSGVAPIIDDLLADYNGDISLAISLHACNDALRNELVPINKQYPLKVLLEAVKRYQNGRVMTNTATVTTVKSSNNIANNDDETLLLTTPAGRRRVTFEYVMLHEVNDSLHDARELIRLLHDIDSLINLIPFNPWEGSRYVCSSPERIDVFVRELEKNGMNVTVRQPRGRDIDGACGQLALKMNEAATLKQ